MDLTLHIMSVLDEPGERCACGVVLLDATAARAVHEGGYLLGAMPGPHAGDFHALIRALELAAPLSPERVDIRCGSQRLVNQVTGVEPCDEADLAPLFEQALQRLLMIDNWQIGRIGKAERERPERLARAALDSGRDVVDLDREEAPRRQRREHTGVPQWTVELLDEPGAAGESETACPARCHAGVRYAFGPDTPAGFCVHATSVSLLDGPLNWPDPTQRRMTTICPHCEIPLRIEMVE